MPHGKARLTGLIEQFDHIFRHVGEHQLTALFQQFSRLFQSQRNIPAGIEAALGEDAVKASLWVSASL